MAVVEIAKIQVRRGDARSVGMPLLDTGELGWAITGTQPDSVSPELFVGNRIADGAQSDSNIRILTEKDKADFQVASVTSSTFIYDGNKNVFGGTGANIFTGDSDTDIVRTVAQKLNDIVSVADFGVFANDDSVSTAVGLQRAIDQLYLNSDKSAPNPRVILTMPPGIFDVSETVYVPPYVTLVGAGQNKTVINFVGEAQPLFQFIDGTSTPGSRVTLNSMNSNSNPRGIVIKGMTLQYSSTLDTATAVPLVRADCATECTFDDVGFGGWVGAGYGSQAGHTGIEVRGLGALHGRHLKIINCSFDTLYYGIKSDYDIEDPVIEGNTFTNLYRGIVFGKALVSGHQTGPKRARIVRNLFNIIAREAISSEATNPLVHTDHISAHNVFDNVGNGSTRLVPGSGDIGGAVAPVIKFGTYGNVSDNDYFSRFNAINSTTTDATFVLSIDGHVNIVDNKVRVLALAAATAGGTWIKLPGTDTISNIKIQYHLTQSGISRWGDLFIVLAQGNIMDITDNYRTLGDDGGIVFDATYSAVFNTIYVSYSGNSADGQITYQINQYY